MKVEGEERRAESWLTCGSVRSDTARRSWKASLAHMRRLVLCEMPWKCVRAILKGLIQTIRNHIARCSRHLRTFTSFLSGRLTPRRCILVDVCEVATRWKESKKWAVQVLLTSTSDLAGIPPE